LKGSAATRRSVRLRRAGGGPALQGQASDGADGSRDLRGLEALAAETRAALDAAAAGPRRTPAK